MEIPSNSLCSSGIIEKVKKLIIEHFREIHEEGFYSLILTTTTAELLSILSARTLETILADLPKAPVVYLQIFS